MTSKYCLTLFVFRWETVNEGKCRVVNALSLSGGLFSHDVTGCARVCVCVCGCVCGCGVRERERKHGGGGGGPQFRPVLNLSFLLRQSYLRETHRQKQTKNIQTDQEEGLRGKTRRRKRRQKQRKKSRRSKRKSPTKAA